MTVQHYDQGGGEKPYDSRKYVDMQFESGKSTGIDGKMFHYKYAVR